MYWLAYQLICLLGFVLGLLPLDTSFALARGTGELCYALMPRRREIALDNIRAALGKELSEKEIQRIARQAFQNACLSIVELFVVKKIMSEAKERFRLAGNEHLEAAFAKGHGVLLVISHLGSWELLAFLPYLTGQPWSVIVKSIRNPYLNRKIDSLRREMSLVPILKSGSIKEVLRNFKQNKGVAVLIDQWAGGEGVWLEFFRRSTSTTSIPARLARQTGCVLVPAYCLREKQGHYMIQIEPPVPFDPNIPDWEISTTLRLNHILEKQIRAYPGQWTWAHRRWKNKPASLRMV